MCLASLSLDDAHDLHRVVVDVLANDRALADYLTAEVLSRLPEDAREFMLSTYVVDAGCRDLADRLTGRNVAVARLPAGSLTWGGGATRSTWLSPPMTPRWPALTKHRRRWKAEALIPTIGASTLSGRSRCSTGHALPLTRVGQPPATC